MTINRVGSGISPLPEYQPRGKNNADAKSVSQKTNDKLEISEEAKVKNIELSDTNKLKLVKERIDSGFYNSDDVISSVADSVLKEVRGA